MTLHPGTRLGPYEILAALGAGGMGEVYRARDTKLNRDVAIKILPKAFTTNPERVVRFDREAQILASLNHPHIAQIYGLERQEGLEAVNALVLELIEGPTLADRIAEGPFRLCRGGAVCTECPQPVPGGGQGPRTRLPLTCGPPLMLPIVNLRAPTNVAYRQT